MTAKLRLSGRDIQLAAVIIVVMLWLGESAMTFIWFNPHGLGFLSVLIPLHDPHSMFSRIVFSCALLFSAGIAARVYAGIVEHERKARESGEKYRGLIESSSDWIWEVDKEGVYTFASPQVKKMLGYRPEEVEGRRPFDFMPPEEVERVSALFDELVRQRKAIVTLLNVYLHKSGRRVVLETSGVPIFDDSGEFSGYCGVDRDVTQRKKAEQTMRLVQYGVERARESVFWFNSKADIVYVNEAACRSLGYSREELLVMNLSHIDPDFPPHAWAPHLAELGRVKSMNLESRHQASDGRIFPVEITSNYLEFEGEEGIFAFAREITERKRKEKVLRLNESRLETLLELGRMSSKTIQEITDFALNEAVGLTGSTIGYLAFLNEDESVLTIHSWSKAAMGECLIQDKPIVYPIEETGLWGEAVRQRKPFITNDYSAPSPFKKGCPEGHVAVIRHMNIPVFDGDRIVAVAGVGNKEEKYDQSDVRQLTLLMEGMWKLLQRKQAEEELQQLRNLLSNVVNSMPSVLIGVDVDGRVIQWNSQAENTTGLSSRKAMGRPVADVFPRLVGEMGRISKAIKNRQVEVESRLTRDIDGMTSFEDMTIYPLVSNGVQGAVIRLDDVTDRVRLEEMMIQSEKMVSIGGLAAGMAHEINNPLGVIMAAAQSISRRFSGELKGNVSAARNIGVDLDKIREYNRVRSVDEYLQGIREAGERAAKIVRNMLSFSRKSDSVLSLRDLGDTLDRAVDMASKDYDLKKRYDFRTINIEREYDSETPPVMIFDTEIEQVFLNLLKNSAQAMGEKEYVDEKPTIILRVALEGKWVCVEIEDNGPGMDEETRKRIFEPFYTTKALGEGTGLGLSVSYFIITDQHKGRLDVFSEIGKFTRFVIRLPVRQPQD